MVASKIKVWPAEDMEAVAPMVVQHPAESTGMEVATPLEDVGSLSETAAESDEDLGQLLTDRLSQMSRRMSAALGLEFSPTANPPEVVLEEGAETSRW